MNPDDHQNIEFPSFKESSDCSIGRSKHFDGQVVDVWGKNSGVDRSSPSSQRGVGHCNATAGGIGVNLNVIIVGGCHFCLSYIKIVPSFNNFSENSSNQHRDYLSVQPFQLASITSLEA